MSTTLSSSDDETTTNPFFNTQNDTDPPTPTATTHITHHHHIPSLNAAITIRQLPSEGLSFQLWPAATTLFTLLTTTDNPLTSLLHSLSSPSRRTRILELGSGTGLVGIAAASILGADVTITDLPHVIPNLHFNAAANSAVVGASGGSVREAELSWGDVGQMERVGRAYDVMIGSDVVYHDHLYEPLIETLRFFMLGGERAEERVKVFVMAHLKRWKKESVFFKRARKFFDVDVVHRDCPEDGKRVGVVVYRFLAKQQRGQGGSGSSASKTITATTTTTAPQCNGGCLENGQD